MIGGVLPITVDARSEASICGRSFAEIVGSNPVGSMEVCLLGVLYVIRYRSVRRADHSSRGVLQSADRETLKVRRPWLTKGCRTIKKVRESHLPKNYSVDCR